MSRFLAPIHSWLFNKIKLHEELESEVISKFVSKYGDDVYEVEKSNTIKYGERIPQAPLEDIIDQGNIHGWLQNKISIAETRQAGILSDLFNIYKSDAVELVKDVYIENAIKNASLARESVQAFNPEDIFKVINNFILDGMPCDSVNKIIESNDNLLEYEKVSCLHIDYWKSVGVDANIMYDLRYAWISAFVSTLNPDFEYKVEGSLHRIIKK